MDKLDILEKLGIVGVYAGWGILMIGIAIVMLIISLIIYLIFGVILCQVLAHFNVIEFTWLSGAMLGLGLWVLSLVFGSGFRTSK